MIKIALRILRKFLSYIHWKIGFSLSHILDRTASMDMKFQRDQKRNNCCTAGFAMVGNIFDYFVFISCSFLIGLDRHFPWRIRSFYWSLQGLPDGARILAYLFDEIWPIWSIEELLMFLPLDNILFYLSFQQLVS